MDEDGNKKAEDDMIFVIIGDDSKDGFDNSESKIENAQDCDIQNVLETVEKHGEFIEIKIEKAEDSAAEETEEYNEYEAIKKELEDPDFISGNFSDYDDEGETERVYSDDDDGWDADEFGENLEEYESQEGETQDDEEEEFEDIEYLFDEYQPSYQSKSEPKHRTTLLKPHEQHSFVKELRQQYPELKNSRKLLVNAVSEVMRSTKAPKPPPGSFVRNGDLRECTICDHLSESVPAAHRHYQEKHGPRYLICLACGVDFRSKTNLYKHEKRCISRDAVIVLKARASLLGNKARSRPYINHRKNRAPRSYKNYKRFNCTECSATFTVQKTLESHMNLHMGLRPFKCKDCPAAYTSSAALSRHVKKHLDCQYICDHCGRIFKIKEALVPHLDTHKPYRKFGCHLCESRYAQKAALQLHIDRVHRNLPPPCACQVCPKRFPRMSLLKVHMLNEHGLNIMTRKMFFKKLPTLSESEMKQIAKVVFAKDVEQPTRHYIPEPPSVPPPDEEYITGEEVIVPEQLSKDQMIDFIKNLYTTAPPQDEKQQVFVIKDDKCIRAMNRALSEV